MARGGVFKPPPIRFYTPRQLRGQANKQVRQSIEASQAPIKTAQAAADARAVAAQKAMEGFGLAAAGILKDSAGQVPQVYRDIAQEQAGLSAGFSKQAGDAVRGEVASSQALIDRLAPGGQATAPDVQGMQDAAYATGGYIPGAQNEQQAAIANRYALEQPAIQTARTQQQIEGAQAQQGVDDQQYVKEMMDIAAQEPQLRTQIMQQLQSNEMAKRAAYVQQQAQAMVQQRFGVSSRQAQQRINIANRQGNARIALGAANLKLSQARDRQSVRQALIAGRRIDASASHAAGYLVDHNGNPITGKNGKPIPVHEAGGGGSGAGGGYGVGSTHYGEAVRSVDNIIPTPKTNPQYFAGSPNTPDAPTIAYKYIARPGKGTKVTGTSPGGNPYVVGWFTNKSAEAAVTPAKAGVATFADGVKYLMNSYGLRRGAARKALIAGGWKPTGQRPKK